MNRRSCPDRLDLGRKGEAAALAAYRRLDFHLLARNWSCPVGELDLVVSRGDLVVFCEVKTRTGSGFGGGHESVTWAKQRKVRQLAELFLMGRKLAPGRVRFDVASVYVPQRAEPEVYVFDDAF